MLIETYKNNCKKYEEKKKQQKEAEEQQKRKQQKTIYDMDEKEIAETFKTAK